MGSDILFVFASIKTSPMLFVQARGTAVVAVQQDRCGNLSPNQRKNLLSLEFIGEGRSSRIRGKRRREKLTDLEEKFQIASSQFSFKFSPKHLPSKKYLVYHWGNYLFSLVWHKAIYWMKNSLQLIWSARITCYSILEDWVSNGKLGCCIWMLNATKFLIDFLLVSWVSPA